MMSSFSSNVIAVMQYHENSCGEKIAFWDRRFLIEVQADATRRAAQQLRKAARELHQNLNVFFCFFSISRLSFFTHTKKNHARISHTSQSALMHCITAVSVIFVVLY
jgi:hypothetical protein